jgi:hypothetical protein
VRASNEEVADECVRYWVELSQTERAASGARINWMFTTEKGRAKMSRASRAHFRPRAPDQRVITTVQRY